VKNIDHFIAISNNIKEKILRFYNREAEVIYPPVETSKFKISDTLKNYFLIVSRLTPYKKIEIAIESFNELKLPLIIIGDGPFKNTLKKMSSSNIKFLGKQSDEQLAYYYSRCQALIFPGEEDFGITPVEAQSSGRPVIAYAAGGALETIVDGTTGILFAEQTSSSLTEAVNKFQKINKTFNSNIIRENALKFDRKIFKISIKEAISKYEKAK